MFYRFRYGLWVIFVFILYYIIFSPICIIYRLWNRDNYKPKIPIPISSDDVLPKPKDDDDKMSFKPTGPTYKKK